MNIYELFIKHYTYTNKSESDEGMSIIKANFFVRNKI